MQTQNVADFWTALPSVYSRFEDKTLLENYWAQLVSLISGLYFTGGDLYDSIGMLNMPATIEDHHQTYDIIYSVNSPEYSGLINTISGTGYQEFYVSPGTFSIPELTYHYYNISGALSSLQTLTENVDYNIQNMERIRFLGSPPFICNANQIHFNGNKLVAETAYRVNPALWGVLPKLVELSDSDIRNATYPAFLLSGTQSDDINHFKYLVWALQNAIRSKPTITNIKHLYGLLRGLPFSYSSGIYTGAVPGTEYPSVGSANYKALYFNGQAFSSGPTPTDYDFFYTTVDNFVFSHETEWEFVAKLDSIPTTDQYVIGNNWRWWGGAKYELQHFYVYFSSTAIHVEVKTKDEYAAGTRDDEILSFNYSYDNFDPTVWHKYYLLRPAINSGSMILYIDNIAVASGFSESGAYMENVLKSDIPYAKATIGGKVSWDAEASVPSISGMSNPFIGYIAKYSSKIYGYDSLLIESDSLHASGLSSIQRYIAPDLGGSYTGYSGLNYITTLTPVAYEWKTVERPLFSYTDLVLGDSINQFQVVVSGINVYDHINNYALISGYCTQDLEKYNLVVISEAGLPSGINFSYNPATLSGVLSNYLPADLKFITIS